MGLASMAFSLRVGPRAVRDLWGSLRYLSSFSAAVEATDLPGARRRLPPTEVEARSPPFRIMFPGSTRRFLRRPSGRRAGRSPPGSASRAGPRGGGLRVSRRLLLGRRPFTLYCGVLPFARSAGSRLSPTSLMRPASYAILTRWPGLSAPAILLVYALRGAAGWSALDEPLPRPLPGGREKRALPLPSPGGGRE